MKRFGLHLWHDYQPLYDRSVHWNWIDYTIIRLSFEYSPYKQSCDIEGGLLGGNFCLNYYYGPDKTTGDSPESE